MIYLYPEFAPDKLFGFDGLLPVAMPHYLSAAVPKLDGVADDAAWKEAPVVNLKALKGETQGTLQVAYTADMIYILLWRPP